MKSSVEVSLLFKNIHCPQLEHERTRRSFGHVSHSGEFQRYFHELDTTRCCINIHTLPLVSHNFKCFSAALSFSHFRFDVFRPDFLYFLECLCLYAPSIFDNFMKQLFLFHFFLLKYSQVFLFYLYGTKKPIDVQALLGYREKCIGLSHVFNACPSPSWLYLSLIFCKFIQNPSDLLLFLIFYMNERFLLETYNYNRPNIKHPSSKTKEINKLIGAKELKVASATKKVLIGGFKILHLQHVIPH